MRNNIITMRLKESKPWYEHFTPANEIIWFGTKYTKFFKTVILTTIWRNTTQSLKRFIINPAHHQFANAFWGEMERQRTSTLKPWTEVCAGVATLASDFTPGPYKGAAKILINLIKAGVNQYADYNTGVSSTALMGNHYNSYAIHLVSTLASCYRDQLRIMHWSGGKPSCIISLGRWLGFSHGGIDEFARSAASRMAQYAINGGSFLACHEYLENLVNNPIKSEDKLREINDNLKKISKPEISQEELYYFLLQNPDNDFLKFFTEELVRSLTYNVGTHGIGCGCWGENCGWCCRSNNSEPCNSKIKTFRRREWADDELFRNSGAKIIGSNGKIRYFHLFSKENEDLSIKYVAKYGYRTVKLEEIQNPTYINYDSGSLRTEILHYVPVLDCKYCEVNPKFGAACTDAFFAQSFAPIRGIGDPHKVLIKFANDMGLKLKKEGELYLDLVKLYVNAIPLRSGSELMLPKSSRFLFEKPKNNGTAAIPVVPGLYTNYMSCPTIGDGDCFFHAIFTKPEESADRIKVRAAEMRATFCDAVQSGEYIENLRPLVYEHYLDLSTQDKLLEIPEGIRSLFEENQTENLHSADKIRAAITPDHIKAYSERFRRVGGRDSYISFRPDMMCPAAILAVQNNVRVNIFTFNQHTGKLNLVKSIGDPAHTPINVLHADEHYMRLSNSAEGLFNTKAAAQIINNHDSI